jgi:hypothetical protein
MKTWENCHDRADAYFVSSEEGFIGSVRGLNWLRSQDIKRSSFKFSTNYIYEDIKDFNKFKNSKILVVGGGPSSSDLEFQSEDYDYIFSCNHFYKSEKFKDTNVDILFIGNEVNTFSSEFLDYCKRSSTYLAIEDLQCRSAHVFNLIHKFPEKAFFCSSRYQSKFTGTASKIVIFALELGAKNVDFIGVDGVASDFNDKQLMPHGFEGEKLFRKKKKSNYLKVISHYKYFDTYIRDFYPNCKINNLGRFNKYNYSYEGN